MWETEDTMQSVPISCLPPSTRTKHQQQHNHKPTHPSIPPKSTPGIITATTLPYTSIPPPSPHSTPPPPTTTQGIRGLNRLAKQLRARRMEAGALLLASTEVWGRVPYTYMRLPVYVYTYVCRELSIPPTYLPYLLPIYLYTHTHKHMYAHIQTGEVRAGRRVGRPAGRAGERKLDGKGLSRCVL